MNVSKFIRLEVTGGKATAMAGNAAFTFDARGGRFGRATDNDWVINDPFISRYQARISFVGGSFHISADPDASVPVFLNSTDKPVLATQTYPLTAGDRILVDEYVIRVGAGSAAEAPGRNGAGAGDAENPFAGDAPPGDIMDVFGATLTHPEDVPPARTAESIHTPIHDNYKPPAIRQGGSAPVLDEDWYKRPPGAEVPAPASAPAPNPNAQVSADLTAFLKGAGLDAEKLTPEVMATLGAIVRVVVDGTVEILRARNQIRREFRLPVTQAERDRNNPLKFSMNAEDALHNILVKKNPAFLAALPAFEEAFDDLRSHQMAMLKGLRVAYEHMLTRFDPRQLESRFESQTKNNTFKGLAGRPKTWEQYTAWYEEQTEDANECFRRMFGEQFAKAYEQELQALARNRRKNRTGA